LPVATLDNSVTPMALREFAQFRALVHMHTGIWLRDGKQIMLASRLSRRLRHHGLTDFAEYLTLVQQVQDNGEELRELINCVTTNKTSFFRENHHFQFLANTIVPAIKSANLRSGPRTIRIWSAASSTGEEAYSIAITLLEAIEGGGATHRIAHPSFSSAGWRIAIEASDIDTKVLATAQRAVYSADALTTVAPPLRKKYFLRGKDDMIGQVMVKPEVRRLAHFQRINLMDNYWPVEGPFDVIFFRNALIYFNQDTQEVFLRKMASLLRPRGYLFLGSAEHIPWLHDILEPLNQTMYRLRGPEE
jgi:chemotaxis protein methyltransferase CheR